LRATTWRPHRYATSAGAAGVASASNAGYPPRDDNAKELAGRTALVTGGSVGIGRAIVLELATLGANVIVCGVAAVSSRNSGGG
jgi:hypothetical protein